MAGTPLLPHLSQATISRTESARVVPGYAVTGWVRGLTYFVLAERLLLAALCRSSLQSLLVKSDAIGAQVQCNFAPDDQTSTFHAKTLPARQHRKGFLFAADQSFAWLNLVNSSVGTFLPLEMN